MAHAVVIRSDFAWEYLWKNLFKKLSNLKFVLILKQEKTQGFISVQ